VLIVFFVGLGCVQVQVAVRKAGGDEFVVEIGVDTGGMFSECEEPLKLHWVSSIWGAIAMEWEGSGVFRD